MKTFDLAEIVLKRAMEMSTMVKPSLTKVVWQYLWDTCTKNALSYRIKHSLFHIYKKSIHKVEPYLIVMNIIMFILKVISCYHLMHSSHLVRNAVCAVGVLKDRCSEHFVNHILENLSGKLCMAILWSISIAEWINGRFIPLVSTMTCCPTCDRRVHNH